MKPPLFMVFSAERGYHTATGNGWSRSAAFAVLFDKAEAADFIASQSEQILMPVLYDPQTSHQDVHVLSHHKQRAFHHPDAIRQAAEKMIRGIKTEGVRFVGHKRSAQQTVTLDADMLNAAAKTFISNLPKPQSTRIVTKLEKALARFDAALDGFRKRMQDHERSTGVISWTRR